MAGMEIDLSGRTAVVTGSSRGIGEAIARGLARCGADVSLFDLPETRADAEALVSSIELEGGTARYIECNVSDPESISKAISQVIRQQGKLDVMVNNAGVVVRKTALELSPEEWDEVMDVNLRGVFFGCQAAGREMVKTGGGAIINTASQLAFVVPRTGISIPYMASKGAVVNLTRALAVEWAEHNIRVNALAPGPTKTRMTRTFDPEKEDWDEGHYDIPLGGMMKTGDMVGAVAYLASDLSSMVTGHTIVVDGGHSLI